MTLELPQSRNANAVVVKVVVADVVDAEAIRGEVSHNHLITVHVLFTVCIGPWIFAK